MPNALGPPVRNTFENEVNQKSSLVDQIRAKTVFKSSGELLRTTLNKSSKPITFTARLEVKVPTGETFGSSLDLLKPDGIPYVLLILVSSRQTVPRESTTSFQKFKPVLIMMRKGKSAPILVKNQMRAKTHSCDILKFPQKLCKDGACLMVQTIFGSCICRPIIFGYRVKTDGIMTGAGMGLNTFKIISIQLLNTSSQNNFNAHTKYLVKCI